MDGLLCQATMPSSHAAIKACMYDLKMCWNRLLSYKSDAQVRSLQNRHLSYKPDAEVRSL
jgi:hypothetical protein